MLFDKNRWISLAGLIGAFLLIVLPSLAEIAPENITGMWLFNEGSGAVAIDSSKYGNDIPQVSLTRLSSSMSL